MNRLTLLQIIFLAALFPALAVGQYYSSNEYSVIGYADEASHNRVARLQERLSNGELELVYDEKHGYLASLLENLEIDPSSQMLVFSPTSLQHRLINPRTPRALYFNDDTYIGYVQNSSIIEITTVDERLGFIFYTFNNAPHPEEAFERANDACLVCHDSQGAMAGGVPTLKTLSRVYSERNMPLQNHSGNGNVEDHTPIADRWGGWYVTGRHGLQPHLGNLRLESADQLEQLDNYRSWNVETLEGYLDTDLYLRPTSDIVALMVLEHQVTVQNQITYIRFKAPAVMERRGLGLASDATTWNELPEAARLFLSGMLDELVQKLVMLNFAELSSPISGEEDYMEWFEGHGPEDSYGRSLRELDLNKSLFRYPLSYLIYTPDFDTLPAYAKDYVYQQLAAYLQGEDLYEGSSQFSIQERRLALDILAATKTEFQSYLNMNGQNLYE
ncbi:MAG: hypothetical protein CMP91_06965 [Gammaproteobacteria bacterium]|mgnify:FL=1|nr:hypothetical protein [Gammaproteobacteria bacterium]|tara:strand:- start:30057 stop:31388 length:1332 start_codon:yes stop_codon:yes gene_type:complete